MRIMEHVLEFRIYCEQQGEYTGAVELLECEFGSARWVTPSGREMTPSERTRGPWQEDPRTTPAQPSERPPSDRSIEPARSEQPSSPQNHQSRSQQTENLEMIILFEVRIEPAKRGTAMNHQINKEKLIAHIAGENQRPN